MSSNAISNHLISRLPEPDRKAVLEIAHPFEFGTGHIFCEPGEPVGFVHFVTSGVISAVAGMADGRTVETFMVGREGATHPLSGEITAPIYSQLVAQIAGSSRRVEVVRLRGLLAQSPALRAELAVYAASLQAELEQSGACNALHRSDQRFAKWLLRCHDRTDGDVLNLTQEYLASMLGSQRTTVNEAAQGLQRLGAIRYSRGKITILDRAMLERAACECYATRNALDRGLQRDKAASREHN